jgi:ABC-2 type transport system ATP-binding protein
MSAGTSDSDGRERLANAPRDAALRARNVRKIYRSRNAPPVEALKDLSLIVGRGERISILGRNGAGKTTFLKIASTLLLPTSGEVEVFSMDVVRNPDDVRPYIAVVPQEGKPFYHLTPREQVFTYLMARGFARETAKSRTATTLEKMGLAEVADRLSVTLSGGQQQRTMVATVLATEAPLMFLDEPTLGMDPFARREVWNALRTLTRQGTTIILTTHYLDEAESLSHRVYIVDRGVIVAEGTSDSLKRKVGGTIRITLKGEGVSIDTYRPYGKCIRTPDALHIITEPDRVSEVLTLAMKQGLSTTVGPVTLEEAFLELVGKAIEDES